jgi:hypothetical protein
MATAVDKWPAYARLSAVAQAGHLPHSSYTITRDTTRRVVLNVRFLDYQAGRPMADLGRDRNSS